MPWLFNEDAAIKAKFSGLTVSDETAPAAGRPVAVRFRLPENELANTTYPQIIIDPAEINKASDREHRGAVFLPYVPEGYEGGSVTGIDREQKALVQNWDPATSPVDQSPFFVAEYPIPFDFDYQVTVQTRLQSHLTQLMLRLAQMDRIPARFGYLEVPADGTVRSLFLIGGPVIHPIRDTDGKRLFQVVYRVRIASELMSHQYKALVEGDLIHSANINVERIP